MNATDNFWDTGVHPITGYIIPGAFNRNTKQNVERLNKLNKNEKAPWGTK
ncbi:hypothetical protein [Leeuwenhoekiella sp. CH_XMU1409-2]